MKVLMQIRKDVHELPGGDYVQLLKTREALQGIGVDVDVSLSHSETLSGYDLVHLFNITRISDTYKQYKNARSRGKRVVLSPIYHSIRDLNDFYRHLFRLPFFRIDPYLSAKEFFYFIRGGSALSPKCLFSYKAAAREILSEADMLLPNSDMELKSLIAEMYVSPQDFQVIPNAHEASQVMPGAICKDELILCIGRIEPMKNQLSVIEAFRRCRAELPSKARLLFVGDLNNKHSRYCRKFLRKVEHSESIIEYVGRKSHEEVLNLCVRSKLLVLASFFETTGLVVLEALSKAANAVVTERGYTREYYEDRVFYCNPYSVESIACAMLKGYHTSPELGLVLKLLEKYTWAHTGELTLKAYDRVLSA